MSKICAAGNNCPYSKQQTTGGCECADLCPGFVEDIRWTNGTTAAEPNITPKG